MAFCQSTKILRHTLILFTTHSLGNPALTYTPSPLFFQDSLSVPCASMHFFHLETFPSDPSLFHTSMPNHLRTKPLSLSFLLHSLSKNPPQLKTTKVTKQIPNVHQPLQRTFLRIQIQFYLSFLSSHTDSSPISLTSLVIFSSSVPTVLIFLKLC